MPEFPGSLRVPVTNVYATSLVAGQLYFDPTSKILNVYNGTNWVPVSPPRYTITALPVSPYDGQEVYYTADTGNSVVWHLRYFATSASAYKWEFLGGPPIYQQIATQETTASGTYVDLTTAGPSVTLALAGDYEVTISSTVNTVSAAGATLMSVKKGTAATSDSEALWLYLTVSGQPTHSTRVMILPGLAASTVLKAQYRTGANATWWNRVLAVRPIRVG